MNCPMFEISEGGHVNLGYSSIYRRFTNAIVENYRNGSPCASTATRSHWILRGLQYPTHQCLPVNTSHSNKAAEFIHIPNDRMNPPDFRPARSIHSSRCIHPHDQHHRRYFSLAVLKTFHGSHSADRLTSRSVCSVIAHFRLQPAFLQVKFMV